MKPIITIEFTKQPRFGRYDEAQEFRVKITNASSFPIVDCDLTASQGKLFYEKSARHLAQRGRSIEDLHKTVLQAGEDGFEEKDLKLKPEDFVDTWDWAERAAKGIKIMSDDREDSAEFKQAKAYLSNSVKICFLGFGYHKENLRRLSGYPSNISGYIVGSYFSPKIQIPERFKKGEMNGFGKPIKIVRAESLSDYLHEVADIA